MWQFTDTGDLGIYWGILSASEECSCAIFSSLASSVVSVATVTIVTAAGEDQRIKRNKQFNVDETSKKRELDDELENIQALWWSTIDKLHLQTDNILQASNTF